MLWVDSLFSTDPRNVFPSSSLGRKVPSAVVPQSWAVTNGRSFEVKQVLRGHPTQFTGRFALLRRHSYGCEDVKRMSQY